MQNLFLVACFLALPIVRSLSCTNPPHFDESLAAGRYNCSTEASALTVDNIPVVGIEIGLTHGISVIAYPNGTIIHAVSVEADLVYQRWIRQNLHRVIDFQDQGFIESSRLQQQPPSKLLERIKKWYTSKPSNPDFVSDELAKRALISLLKYVKSETEEILGKELTDIHLALPSVLTHAQKQLIHSALETTSLRSISCPGLENSALMTTLFTRQRQWKALSSQPHQHHPRECSFGPPGVEQVVVAEYTGDALVVELFQLRFGRKLWVVEEWVEGGSFVGLHRRNERGMEDDGDDDDEGWERARESVRSMIPAPLLYGKWTMRLLIRGSKSKDPKFLKLLESSLGELVVVGGQAHAVRIEVEEEVVQENRRVVGEGGFMEGMCTFMDTENEEWVKDSEAQLIELVGMEKGGEGTEGRWEAAGGTAGMGLEMGSWRRGCEEWGRYVVMFGALPDADFVLRGVLRDEL